MSDTEVLEAPVSTESAESAVPDNSDAAALAFDLPEPGSDATPQYVEDIEPEVPVEEPAAEPPAEVSAEEPADFDESLLSLAERYDISKEQAESLGGEALQLMLAKLDRQAAAWGEAQLGQESGTQPQEQQRTDATQQNQPAPQSQQQQAQQQAAIEKFKLEANADDWDAETLKAFNGINDHYHGVITQQQQELAQMRELVLGTHDFVAQLTGQSQQAEAVQIERDLDSFFGSLGEEFAAVYGKGPIKGLRLDSTEVKNRQEVFKKMRALELADQHQGRPPMERTELLKRVNAFLHPDLLKNTARKEVAQKLKDRSKQTLARPAGKQGKPQTAEEAALQYLRQAMPRLGH